MPADHSRATKLGSAITGQNPSQLQARLEAGSISIGCDPAIPGVPLAALVLVRTLRRLPGRLRIDPTGVPRQLLDQLVEAAADVDPDRSAVVARPRANDVVVRLAPVAPSSVLRVVPDLHGYRIATRGAPLVQVRPASALGSVSAAAAAAAELFKVSAGVIGLRGLLVGRRAFCPVTLSSHPESGPDLAPDWRLIAMLLGLGAIGTGTCLILSHLPVEGVLDLIDPQRYAIENVGTYSLGGASDGVDRPWKTDVVGRVLNRFDIRPRQEYAADLPALIDAKVMAWPSIVLTGLDSPQARRDSQRIWPDLLIDGGTGDTMVGLHTVIGAGRPCLACFLPDRGVQAELPAAALAAATGLSRELLVQGERTLKETDLHGLADEQRARLLPHIGKEVCGLARALGLTELADEGYQPAVPFVSLTAATLVVGRLIAEASGIDRQSNFVQFDALVGPRRLTSEWRRGRTDCDCTTRSHITSAVRRRRVAAR